jgi:hypothetical protein
LAKKDKYNREKEIKRLKDAYKSGRITKENINKRGYNKFLEISDNIHVAISREKIKEDERWDGLKGYLTNTKLPVKEVYEQYRELWVVALLGAAPSNPLIEPSYKRWSRRGAENMLHLRVLSMNKQWSKVIDFLKMPLREAA